MQKLNRGLCIDPSVVVARAIVTHGHADHFVRGCGAYLCSAPTAGILRRRLDSGARIETLAYGESVDINGVKLSFHPAGHILGSAQVRLERGGRVEVVSGDYKLQADPTCAGFEPVRCDFFLSECSFGKPSFVWPDPLGVKREIDRWWVANQAEGRSSVLFTYSLGKAQRLLAMLDPGRGPILAHPAIRRMCGAYREAGVQLPRVGRSESPTAGKYAGRAMILAPPTSVGSPWLKRFEPLSTAMASGWVLNEGWIEAKGLDRGFALSDHADWPGLLEAIDATGAQEIALTHGDGTELASFLRDHRGLDARQLEKAED